MNDKLIDTDASTRVQQHTEELDTQKNLAKLSPDISFIDKKGEQAGGYYSTIQGHRISRNNTHLRIILIHSIIDIETTDAKRLSNIIYQRTHNEIEVGKHYDGVDVIDILLTDAKPTRISELTN